jgi:hypothetical protein
MVETSSHKDGSWFCYDRVRQKAVFACLKTTHAQNFLLAITIDGLGQHKSLVEYHIVLRYHLMIPLFPIDEVCLIYRKTWLDTFGGHAAHCRKLTWFKYMHKLKIIKHSKHGLQLGKKWKDIARKSTKIFKRPARFSHYTGKKEYELIQGKNVFFF